MALPAIKTPEYSMVVPSTQEEIKYRPFLVGEEKILLLAMEGNDQIEIQNAVMNLVRACTYDKIGRMTDPLFDVEFAFLRIRGKSISESVDLKLKCPDDEKTIVDVTINTDEIEVQVSDDHDTKIELNDEFSVIMRYPTFSDAILTGESDTEKVFYILKSCIDEIHHKDTIYNKVDLSNKELDTFFDSMTQGMFAKIKEFFDTMPKLRHVIEIKNPKTKRKSEVVLEGLSDFLG